MKRIFSRIIAHIASIEAKEPKSRRRRPALSSRSPCARATCEGSVDQSKPAQRAWMLSKATSRSIGNLAARRLAVSDFRVCF